MTCRSRMNLEGPCPIYGIFAHFVFDFQVLYMYKFSMLNIKMDDLSTHFNYKFENR